MSPRYAQVERRVVEHHVRMFPEVVQPLYNMGANGFVGWFTVDLIYGHTRRSGWVQYRIADDGVRLKVDCYGEVSQPA